MIYAVLFKDNGWRQITEWQLAAVFPSGVDAYEYSRHLKKHNPGWDVRVLQEEWD